jgi:dephospho-CoA kinase
MLQHSGAYTIDADSLAHQAMMPGAPAYKPIVDAFGQFIVGADNQINRAILGQIAFSNPDALKKLEAITHPLVRQAIDVLVKRSKQRVVVIEAIKLLDGDLASWCDSVWVVNASPQNQYRRLVGKRKMSEEDAKRRITSQGAQAEKLSKANVVIQNDGDVEQTWKQVQDQWDAIRTLLSAQSAPAQAAPQPQQPQPPAAAAAAPAQSAIKPITPPEKKLTEVTPLADDLSPEVHTVQIEDLKVTRGMPKNAQQIADFITAHGGQEVSRMDIMMNFGQKSYLVAQDASESVIAVLGWTVENLVTRMDELYFSPSAPTSATIHVLIVAVEEASKQLQSEAAFLFLPQESADAVIKAFNGNGYQQITLKEIKIPVWREAVEENLRDKQSLVLWKQLRQDRVLQPI